MNEHTPDHWQELSRIWKTRDSPVTVKDIETMHERQNRRLRVVRAAELAGAVLGGVAAVWLALVTRFVWVGLLTTASLAAWVFFVHRAHRLPVPEGSTDLLESLRDSLTYLDWLAEQLRYGRILGFVALFAVVMAASTQLMHLARVPQSGLLATAAAGSIVSAALAWNMRLSWQVWRRAVRTRAFKVTLESERGGALAPPSGDGSQPENGARS